MICQTIGTCPYGGHFFVINYCMSNNIDYVSLYELRHTFVSIVKALPEGTVKQIVGHSQDMDTFGIYGHEISGDDEKAAKSIDNIFNNLISQNRVGY